MAGELHSTAFVSPIRGNIRRALDASFNGTTVETIIAHLKTFETDKDAEVAKWATATRTALELRSPTSLKVTLRAIRETKRDFASPNSSSLRELFQRDMRIATAFCVCRPYVSIHIILLTYLFSERSITRFQDRCHDASR